jgi:hypothetical protein
VEVKAGRAGAGEDRLRAALGRLRERRGPSPSDNRLPKLEAIGEHALGRAAEARGRGAGCPHHQRAHAVWTQAMGGRPLTKADTELAGRLRQAAEGCGQAGGPPLAPRSTGP